MPAAKPVRLQRPIKFDDAMRRLVRLPPPPTSKKAKRATAKKAPTKKRKRNANAKT
jgi:hypothetical protein